RLHGPRPGRPVEGGGGARPGARRRPGAGRDALRRRSAPGRLGLRQPGADRGRGAEGGTRKGHRTLRPGAPRGAARAPVTFASQPPRICTFFGFAASAFGTTTSRTPSL